MINGAVRFYTWVKHSEGAQKPPAKQGDVEAINLMSKNEQDANTVIWQHQEEQEEKEKL